MFIERLKTIQWKAQNKEFSSRQYLEYKNCWISCTAFKYVCLATRRSQACQDGLGIPNMFIISALSPALPYCSWAATTTLCSSVSRDLRLLGIHNMCSTMSRMYFVIQDEENEFLSTSNITEKNQNIQDIKNPLTQKKTFWYFKLRKGNKNDDKMP